MAHMGSTSKLVDSAIQKVVATFKVEVQALRWERP